MVQIESLLAARLFLRPQAVGNRVYFISNLSGHLSLYAMNFGGSVPEPLLPPNLALQNPHLLDGKSFYVFPQLGKIIVMIDRDGDENYQPMAIPLEGGIPQPIFDNYFQKHRVHLGHCDPTRSIVYFSADFPDEGVIEAYRGNLERDELVKLGASPYGCFPDGIAKDHKKAILIDGYSTGDEVLYLWREGSTDRRLIYGKPIENRAPNETVELNGIQSVQFFQTKNKILFITTLYTDTGSLACLDIETPEQVQPIDLKGIQHAGLGEMVALHHTRDFRYLIEFNIDGCSWLYECELDEDNLKMVVLSSLCGTGTLSSGVLEAVDYDEPGDRFALAFSTATSPTQIYTIEGKKRKRMVRHTNERILGIPQEWLSAGEDAAYTSFDGTRISARLYLPSASLGYQGPRPVVLYVHGGPQGQERPDFAWFSMPLIQFMTLNGLAVFVPNVRGSSGYGLNFTKQVDRDWGGQDRLDHIHALTQVLPKDARLDTQRAGVVGRSYGGYMTLTLAGRHPELWSAAVDMFGPYDLLTFFERIPPTWKPYFRIALGDPEVEADRQLLIERSPRTYLHQLECPLLVIQGKNDPRVVELESRDLVNELRSRGKQIDYLMFENEGHDVLKYENRVTCYNTITQYFVQHLKP